MTLPLLVQDHQSDQTLLEKVHDGSTNSSTEEIIHSNSPQIVTNTLKSNPIPVPTLLQEQILGADQNVQETSENVKPAPPTKTKTSVASTSNSSKQKKRDQVKQACVNCKKSCKKCDEVRPCTRCVKMGLQDTCQDAPRPPRKFQPRGPNKRTKEREEKEVAESVTSHTDIVQRNESVPPVQHDDNSADIFTRESSTQTQSENLGLANHQSAPVSHSKRVKRSRGTAIADRIHDSEEMRLFTKRYPAWSTESILGKFEVPAGLIPKGYGGSQYPEGLDPYHPDYTRAYDIPDTPVYEFSQPGNPKLASRSDACEMLMHITGHNAERYPTPTNEVPLHILSDICSTLLAVADSTPQQNISLMTEKDSEFEIANETLERFACPRPKVQTRLGLLTVDDALVFDELVDAAARSPKRHKVLLTTTASKTDSTLPSSNEASMIVTPAASPIPSLPVTSSEFVNPYSTTQYGHQPQPGTQMYQSHPNQHHYPAPHSQQYHQHMQQYASMSPNVYHHPIPHPHQRVSSSSPQLLNYQPRPSQFSTRQSYAQSPSATNHSSLAQYHNHLPNMPDHSHHMVQPHAPQPRYVVNLASGRPMPY